MASGASASAGTGVSGSLSVWARLFPSRLFGYTFLGNAKKECCFSPHNPLDMMLGVLTGSVTVAVVNLLRAPRERGSALTEALGSVWGFLFYGLTIWVTHFWAMQKVFVFFLPKGWLAFVRDAEAVLCTWGDQRRRSAQTNLEESESKRPKTGYIGTKLPGTRYRSVVQRLSRYTLLDVEENCVVTAAKAHDSSPLHAHGMASTSYSGFAAR